MDTVDLIVFVVLSGLTLGSAALVVTARNLFHAGLYLMVSLFGVAGLFALLSGFFLAGVQVVVYIGAIAILIIMAVMLTPEVTAMRRTYTGQWQAGLAVAVVFFLLVVAVVTPLVGELGADNFNADFTEDHPADVPGFGDTVRTLGEKMVDPHGFMVPFELASVLLMAAMIGAVVIVWPRQDDGEDSADELSAPGVPVPSDAGDD